MPFWNPLIGGSKILELEITANTTNYNIKTEADTAAGGDSAGYPKIILTIPNTVIVGSSSTGTYALDVGAFNPYQDIEIVNDGAVVGRGGNGGAGAPAPQGQQFEGSPGGPGGLAMKAPGSAKSVTFVNNGILGGGGGGGDGGRKYPQPNPPVQGQNAGKPQTPVQQPVPPTNRSGMGGGGGAGYPVGTGGPQPAPHPTYQPNGPAVIQGTGPYTFIGGGAPGNDPPNSLGGPGGNLGQDGGSDTPGGQQQPTIPGGAAGPYLDGTQYVTIQGNAGQGPSQTT